LKSNSGPKKANLCTTKFIDDSKTVASTEVAVPIPLPEDFAHFARKGDAEMPTGEGKGRSGNPNMELGSHSMSFFILPR